LPDLIRWPPPTETFEKLIRGPADETYQDKKAGFGPPSLAPVEGH